MNEHVHKQIYQQQGSTPGKARTHCDPPPWTTDTAKKNRVVGRLIGYQLENFSRLEKFSSRQPITYRTPVNVSPSSSTKKPILGSQRCAWFHEFLDEDSSDEKIRHPSMRKREREGKVTFD